MPTFVVAGNATHSHPAERATAVITVAMTSPKREVASRAAVDIHNAVVAEAKAHHASGAATWWSADRVETAGYNEYVKNSDNTVVRYRARSRIEVKFHDFGVLATWITGLSEREGVNIDGITWALTVGRRAEAERSARIAAVKDALTKADDYAAGLDLGAPTLQAVYEDGLRPNVQGSMGSAGMSTRGTASAANSGSLELKPKDIDVSARISADFTF